MRIRHLFFIVGAFLLVTSPAAAAGQALCSGLFPATLRCPEGDGPFPAVIVANGFLGARWNISWIPETLTSKGYVTLAFSPPLNMLPDTTQWAKGFEAAVKYLRKKDIVDTRRIGAVGFSMGGAGAIEAASSLDDITAVVLLAPANMSFSDAGFYPRFAGFDLLWRDTRAAAEKLDKPSMFIYGSNDGIVPPDAVKRLFELVPETTPKSIHTIKGGNHAGFIDPFFAPIGSLLDHRCRIGCKKQRKAAEELMLPWLDRYLAPQ